MSVACTFILKTLTKAACFRSNMTSPGQDREVTQVLEQLISEDSSPEQQRQKQRKTRASRSSRRQTQRATPSSDTSTNDDTDAGMATAMTNYTRGNTPAGFAFERPRSVFTLAGQGEISLLKEHLSQTGMNVQFELNKTDENGCTPLMYAANFGQDQTVKFLLQQGADVNLTDNTGKDALMLAAIEGHADVIAVLLSDSRVDVNRTEQFGNTATMFAASENHVSCVKLLLDFGGDAFHKNPKSFSAYDLCVGRGHSDVQQLFEAKLLQILLESK